MRWGELIAAIVLLSLLGVSYNIHRHNRVPQTGNCQELMDWAYEVVIAGDEVDPKGGLLQSGLLTYGLDLRTPGLAKKETRRRYKLIENSMQSPSDLQEWLQRYLHNCDTAEVESLERVYGQRFSGRTKLEFLYLKAQNMRTVSVPKSREMMLQGLKELMPQCGQDSGSASGSLTCEDFTSLVWQCFDTCGDNQEVVEMYEALVKLRPKDPHWVSILEDSLIEMGPEATSEENIDYVLDELRRRPNEPISSDEAESLGSPGKRTISDLPEEPIASPSAIPSATASPTP